MRGKEVVTLRLLDAAEEELLQSARWYDDKRTGLGDAFLDTAQTAFELIEAHPKRFKPIKTRRPKREVRRVLLKRFPFKIVYEILPDEIVVVAVAHAKRKPNYWQDRLD
jgi:plasmid stabilization system protein ParE